MKTKVISQYESKKRKYNEAFSEEIANEDSKVKEKDNSIKDQ
jgi:hypothetical protein